MSSRFHGVRETPSPSLGARVLTTGPAPLSDVDLLTLLLSTRGRVPAGASALAVTLLADGRDAFARQDFATGAHALALGGTTAVWLRALLEFSQRLTRPLLPARSLLSAPEQVTAYLHARGATWPQERIGALFLDTRHRLIVERELIRGSLDHAACEPRDVLRQALLDGAASFVLFHNHPSGDPTPSRDDVDFTRQLAIAARTVGLQLHDHVIVGREGVVSMARRGLLAP